MSLVHFPDIMGAIPAKIALLYFLFCHLRHLLIAERNNISSYILHTPSEHVRFNQKSYRIIYIAFRKHHIRCDFMINDKYHIQYYFMCLVRLSYQWQVSRRADPKLSKSDLCNTHVFSRKVTDVYQRDSVI
jgi:hypothetical protein